MKGKKILIVSLFSVIALGLVTFWHLKRLADPLSKLEFPNLEMTGFNLLPSQETNDYTEFISSDGRLKLKYPSNWGSITPDFLEKLNEGLTNERFKNLLFTQGFKIETGDFVFLMVQELNLEEEENLEDVVETIKERMGEQGGKIEISDLRIEDKTAYFEGKFEGENPPPLYLKEKIGLFENKAYLVVFLNFKNDWSKFENEVSGVLNSMEILD